MATTGQLFGTSVTRVVNNSSVVSNPNNVLIDDGAYASQPESGGYGVPVVGYSDSYKISFNITPSILPLGAKIRGFIVKAKCMDGVTLCGDCFGSVVNYTTYAFKITDDVNTSIEKTQNGSGSSWVTHTLGSTSDIWSFPNINVYQQSYSIGVTWRFRRLNYNIIYVGNVYGWWRNDFVSLEIIYDTPQMFLGF